MVIRRSETIRELPDGRWLNKHTGRYHKGAARAQAAVFRRDKAITRANKGAAVITVITWEPITELGTRIVKAITT